MEDAPWRIFLHEKGAWRPVGRMQHRPGSGDIEAALAAAAAVDSPLTKAAQGVKGLFDKMTPRRSG